MIIPFLQCYSEIKIIAKNSCVVFLSLSSPSTILLYRLRKIFESLFGSEVGSVSKISSFPGSAVDNSLISLCNVGELSRSTVFFVFLPEVDADDSLLSSLERFFCVVLDVWSPVDLDGT